MKVCSGYVRSVLPFLLLKSPAHAAACSHSVVPFKSCTWQCVDIVPGGTWARLGCYSTIGNGEKKQRWDGATRHVHMAAAIGCEPLPLIRGASCTHFPKVIYNIETEYMCLSFLFFKLYASVKPFEIYYFTLVILGL